MNHEYFPISNCLIHGTKSLGWGKYAGAQPNHHNYYIWVPMMMVLQAAISYLPHHLWYYWEGEMTIYCTDSLPISSTRW